MQFLGIKDHEKNPSEVDAVSAILGHLQDVLGIKELEELRRYAIMSAISRLKSEVS